MPKLTISDVEAGMVLSSDVKDRSGRMLLKAGMDLTEKHLKVFKIWGIVQVEIEGEEGVTSLQAVIDAHPELQQEANHAAKNIFRHVDLEHPFFTELIALWIQRYIKKRAADT